MASGQTGAPLASTRRRGADPSPNSPPATRHWPLPNVNDSQIHSVAGTDSRPFAIPR